VGFPHPKPNNKKKEKKKKKKSQLARLGNMVSAMISTGYP
jgi:hypothetical protein